MEDIRELLADILLVLIAGVFAVIATVFVDVSLCGIFLCASLAFLAWGAYRGIRAIVNHKDGKKE